MTGFSWNHSSYKIISRYWTVFKFLNSGIENCSMNSIESGQRKWDWMLKWTNGRTFDFPKVKLLWVIEWITKQNLLRPLVFIIKILYLYKFLIISESSCSFHYCQTPTQGETWKLTLLSRGKKKKNKNDPHLNSPRRGFRRVSNLCMDS